METFISRFLCILFLAFAQEISRDALQLQRGPHAHPKAGTSDPAEAIWNGRAGCYTSAIIVIRRLSTGYSRRGEVQDHDVFYLSSFIAFYSFDNKMFYSKG